MWVRRAVAQRGRVFLGVGAAAGAFAAYQIVKYTNYSDVTFATAEENTPIAKLKVAIELEKASLYGWGHAAHLLGVGGKQLNTPTKLALGMKAKAVALGSDQAAVIDSDGKLFSIRNNNNGGFVAPTQLATEAKFTQVALGKNGFMVALAKNGYVYYRQNFDSPLKRLDTGDISKKTVTKVAAGANHAAVICSDGSAFAWGNNETGAVGQPYAGNQSFVPLPQQLKHENDKFVDIACGRGHTVAITKSGRVISTGLNRHCQTGHNHYFANGTAAQPTPPPWMLFGASKADLKQNVETRRAFLESLRADDPAILSVFQPKAVKFFDDEKIQAKRVVCGDDFTVVASQNQVYSFGRGDHAALGNGKITHINMPALLKSEPFANDHSLKELSCGSEHCVALLSTGDLYSWGWNVGSGSTGLGNFQMTKKPTKVLNSKSIKYVHCNGDSSVVITE